MHCKPNNLILLYVEKSQRLLKNENTTDSVNKK